jgi:hypothetical protein
MPFNEGIESRIQEIVSKWSGTTAIKMFGGMCHLLRGNMFGGVYRDFLILRLGEDQANFAMEMPHVRPFDITGRPMKGWVMVKPEGFETDNELAGWLGKARKFVLTLPAKGA